MKYQVTFSNGQVSVYDTKTSFEEFSQGFPGAVCKNLDAPVVEDEAPKSKKAKKSDE